MGKKSLNVIMQGFYGNKVMTSVDIDRINTIIVGIVHGDIDGWVTEDRTIGKFPNVDDVVFIYNKYYNDDAVKEMEREGYEINPTISIPENNFNLYVTCIVCHMDKDGNLSDLTMDDFKKVEKYLSN